MEHASEEELHGLYLNTRNRVVAHRMIYRGNVNSTAVTRSGRPRSTGRRWVSMKERGLMGV